MKWCRLFGILLILIEVPIALFLIIVPGAMGIHMVLTVTHWTQAIYGIMAVSLYAHPKLQASLSAIYSDIARVVMKW